MIYRLRFCNKDGIEARVDIQKGLATPVIEVEGTERPFILSYNNDKGNKSGMFLSSSADIEIYETSDFNIDNLKTSNETELAVTYYINNIVKWQGFIIPDFFSIEVRNNPVITMTASDRLGTLKNVTLDDLPTMVNIRELTLTCLSKTGLSLPLKTIADFSNDGTNNAFFSYYVDSQRIKDIKGRSISCYNILSSILIVSRSKLVQRAGEWVIINKLQHEIGSGKLYSDTDTFTNYLESIYNFEEVSIGARRTIMPVAGSVGIYHEHGGRKSHPANYDFSLGLSGWNSVNGFVATIENRHIIGFLGGTPLFDDERTVKQYLLNYNNWIDNTTNLNTAPYISTDAIPINSPRADRVEVTVDISSTMAEKLSSNTAISFLRYAVTLTNGVKTYTLTKAGIFEELDPENISGHSLLLRGGQQPPLLLASPAFSNSDSFKGLFEVGEDDDVNNYSATIRIYGSGDQYVTVNYALIKFSDVSELPKGTMYKTEQGNVFTKAYEIETSIFGDYLLSGLDGYFYRYPNDDTSSIYKDVNTLSTPVWTTPMIPSETSELPLLHHSMRQMRRMFSVAHDLLSAEIEVSDFDPLAIFVSCNKRYTVVSAQFDFFKSNLSVELEEVAFQNANVRDFIYSYFGDGESGIKSIGGISGGTGGGGGAGGGLTPEQIEILSFWKKDPDNPNTIFTEMNAYSTKELSAYSAGDGGGSGGGGGIIETVYGYGNLGQTFNNSILTDTFNAYTINSIHERVQVLETGGGGGGGSTVEWGTLTSGYRQLTVDGVTYALAQNTHKHLWADITDKPSTFTPSAHTHLWADITGKPSTFTPSSHSHGWSEITGKPSTFTPSAHSHAISDVTGLQTELDGKSSIGHSHSWNSITDKPSTFTPSAHSHGWSEITDKPSTFAPSAHTHLASHITSGTFAIGRIPTGTTGTTVALGNHTHSWADITDKPSTFGSLVTWGSISSGYRQLTVDGVTYALAQNTHKHLWADITDKPSTFAPSAHTHLWADITDKPSTFAPSAHSHGWSEITGKPSTFAPSAHSHGWSEITDKPSTFAPSAHTHSAGDITSGTFAIGRIPTGTTGSTVALGNHSHTGVYEPVFSKNTAFNKDFGTASGTVAEGNHTHSYLPLSGGTLTGNITAPSFIGSLTGNADTATKLQTARTLTVGNTGKTFNGSANVSWSLTEIGAASLSQSVLAGNGLTGGGTLAADRTITLGTPSNITLSSTNSVTTASHTHNFTLGGTASQYLNGATTLVTIPTVTAGNGLTGGGQLTSGITLTLATPGTLTAATTNGVTASSHTHAITTTSVGAANTIVQTDATGGTKLNNLIVGGNWKLEQVGTELQLKYNDVVAQRFLLDGSIVGLGEITAYGASTGGEGVSLLRTGGTMTGNLTMSADIIMNSGRAIGASNLPLKLLGNALTYNASNVLTEANTATQIKMGNGWTIEQTTSALTIKKNGVVKGTFNA